MLFDVLRRKESPKDAPLYLERLRLHTYTILAFLVGGVAGIWLWHSLNYYFLVLIGLGLMGMALVAMLKTQPAGVAR